jgi:hypothetical protein
MPPADADEPNDVAKEAQVLATSAGFTDAIADFGDDRRDVYKLYVRAGDVLQVRTEGLPLGGNLGLDVAIYRPGSINLSSPATRSLASKRSTSADSVLRIRNTTAKDGFFYVQASVRRGWGAYRLRWNTSVSQQ